jgi:hypothetical protein
MLKSNVTHRAFLVCLKKTGDIYIYVPGGPVGNIKKDVVCSIEAILVCDLFRVYIRNALLYTLFYMRLS